MEKEQLKEKLADILESWGNCTEKVDKLMQLLDSEEKVKEEEPGWEIVAVKNDKYKWIKLSEDIWRNTGKENGRMSQLGVNKALENQNVHIEAIRIKSTGKVFQLGDKVVWDWADTSMKYATITEIKVDEIGHPTFFLKENEYHAFDILNLLKEYWNLRHYEEPEVIEMVIDGTTYRVSRSMADNMNQVLQDALAEVKEGTKESQEEPIKPEVLVHTEDIGAIYSNENKVYGVNIHWDCDTCYPDDVCTLEYKYFSTVAARDVYIMYNKPVLSLDDIYRMSSNGYITIEKEPLVKKMVEQRIKQ